MTSSQSWPPELDGTAGRDLAERLCGAIGEIAPDGAAPLGASLGAAIFPDDATTLDGLLAAADARLREAKRAKASRYSRISERPGSPCER